MNYKEKLIYFEKNFLKLLNSDENIHIRFITEHIEDDDIKKSISSWPDSIKIKIVDKFIANQ